MSAVREDIDELRQKVASMRWHHSMDLGHGIVTPGTPRDLEQWFKRFEFPADLTGKTVLDIGAWDGACSFEAHRRGASRVLATDSYVWEHGLKEGFLLARSILAPKVEDMTIDILELSPKKLGGTFDVVFFLGVLYHMRHPLLALERVFSVTKELAIVETMVDMLEIDRPAIAFYPNDEFQQDPTNWSGPNPAAVEAMLKSVGFSKVSQVNQGAVRFRSQGARETTPTKVSSEQIPVTHVAFHAWK